MLPANKIGIEHAVPFTGTLEARRRGLSVAPDVAAAAGVGNNGGQASRSDQFPRFGGGWV